MANKIENSVEPKSEPNPSLDWPKYKELGAKMREAIENYMLSLHGITDASNACMHASTRFLATAEASTFSAHTTYVK